MIVVIPTAGLGSRMQNLTARFNKSLLPYKGKPILSHIIDLFPIDTKFLIPVGHEKQKVVSFCKIVYPERNISFVDIDDFKGSSSGPGYTLRKCEGLIKSSFWYIPCDSYYEEVLPENPQEDLYLIKNKNTALDNREYTTFKIKHEKIIDLQFKQPTDSTYKIFTGVMFIHDFEKYFSILNNNNCKEVIEGISLGSKIAELNSWEDMGNYENYCKLIADSTNYDFSKTDEYTFFIKNKVVKYFSDKKIASKKYIKGAMRQNVVPTGLQLEENWLSYDFVPGKTLYEFKDLDILKQLLYWLDKTLWRKSTKDISKDAEVFYKEKTYERLEKLRKKYFSLPIVVSVDNEFVKSISHYLNNLNWNDICNQTKPAYTHGDLHFENMITNENREFYMIDWRHEFGSSVEVGDVYYDLAKLYGGFILNYPRIKNGEFDVVCTGTNYNLTVPNIDNIELYIEILEKFIVDKGYDLLKVKTLVPIIFLNMSPLHTKPFDLFLYCLSLKLFERIENKKALYGS